MEVLQIKKPDLRKTINQMRMCGVDYNKEKKNDKVKGCFIGIRQKEPDEED